MKIIFTVNYQLNSNDDDAHDVNNNDDNNILML